MSTVTELINVAQGNMPAHAAPPRFVDLLQEGLVPKERLGRLAGELYQLVRCDRRSFAVIAARFPDAPAGDLYLAMAEGEGEALRLLVDFAAALGIDVQALRGHDPLPLAQAYPAYLTQSAVFGTSSDIALALLANAQESGRTYARIADALVTRYGFQEPDVAHFRFFAETPQPLLDQAVATLESGLAAGDDPMAAVRCARTVHALESEFWTCLARDLDIG
ncbi:hypothetical protein GCM10010095_61420 [Streptomyces anthocyanicus]|uniref:hypothetical protein n=1 Tax=Streptomyces anthocyanicus TaxID=68174 RepID=UPI00166FEC4A|nr:hypothetical protein [Streptomyces anthocyanicus]GGL68262.1 hypothetical protein GCM10010095_61420 [Streptomyces anthocyanicus]